MTKPLPEAKIRPERRLTWVWLVPLGAVVLAAWLGVTAWQERGTIVHVQLGDGHGLKVGDVVRYRGTVVGEVREITLADDLTTVRVTLSMRDQADRLARAGSRFWVVRPRLQLSRVEGIETLIGPRYLTVVPPADPDSARRQREFVGLDEPPVVAAMTPGDLEVVLEATERGSLQPGAPVLYRQVRIGTVLSVGLASDGSEVEARVHIMQPYRDLVRERTRFWDAGGLRSNLGLTGLTIEVDSLTQLLTGGVALATPPPDNAGTPVRTGHRFAIVSEPEETWLEWNAAVAVGSELLPAGAALPHPLRATIGWKQGFLIKGARSRQGWVLQVDGALLGPPDLLTADPADRAVPESVGLEVAGREVTLSDAAISSWGELGRLETSVSERVWPADRIRAAAEPEDCIAVGDPTAPPLPIASSRLFADGTGWRVDAAVSVDPALHGACVLSRADGAMVGMLLIDKDGARVGLAQ